MDTSFNHVDDTCPLSKYEGSLQSLHDVDAAVVRNDHSFPLQIFRSSAGRFAKFRGLPWKIVPSPRPVRTFVKLWCNAVNSLLTYDAIYSTCKQSMM